MAFEYFRSQHSATDVFNSLNKWAATELREKHSQTLSMSHFIKCFKPDEYTKIAQ